MNERCITYFLLSVWMYSCSTFCRAHGVLRKNVRLELMLGSLAKQFILILRAISSHPYCSTRVSRMNFRVLPCKGSLLMCSLIIIE